MVAEQRMLLPVDYFHVVFTLPHALNPLIRVNPRALYKLLFNAAAQTLLGFARNPGHLGAEPAITMVLHTWGQTLTEHVHVHCVVSGGGLAPDRGRWVSPKRRTFLFPVRALSKVFRGKYLAGLDRLRASGKLRFAGQCAGLAADLEWQLFSQALRRDAWVVYAKPPFGGPERVLKYLSRYTHRIAISNRRLLFVGDGVVRFTYKDYADASTRKELTLSAEEFLRRFLLHVVPRGFMRIRHYGLLANRHRTPKLSRCRLLLGEAPRRDAPPDGDRCAPEIVNDAPRLLAAACPVCGAPLRIVERIAPQRLDCS
jgi:hypothetical protein